MKLKPHTKYQIISVFAMIAVFTLTVLYSKGYFDFTFITHKGDFGILKEIEIPETEPERVFGEDEIQDNLMDAMDGMDEIGLPPEEDEGLYFPNPEDFPSDTTYEEFMPTY